MHTRSMTRKRQAGGEGSATKSPPVKRSSTRKQGRSKAKKEDCFQLSDSIWICFDKKISKHGHVYEGEMRSEICGSRPIVVKVVPNIKESITEARILSKLSNLSHVVSIIHADIYTHLFFDQIYIALDKCHNENLRQFVSTRREQGIPFDSKQAIEIAKQLIDGVECIHDKKIIHKDLKPDNILFSLDHKLIKIADFGVSEEIDCNSEEISHKGHFGTDGYRPPESFGIGVISQKSDIFSLGAVFYYILSHGEHPFGDDQDCWNYNVINDIVDLSRLLVSNVNTTKHLIKCMIKKKLRNRPTILQVSQHPCWTGNEIECKFDYHCDEASDSTSESASHEKKLPVIYVNRDNVPELRKILKKYEEQGSASSNTSSEGARVAEATNLKLGSWKSTNSPPTAAAQQPRNVGSHVTGSALGRRNCDLIFISPWNNDKQHLPRLTSQIYGGESCNGKVEFIRCGYDPDPEIIQERLSNMPTCDEGITMIIVAFSFATLPLIDALEEDNLRRFLQSKGLSGEDLSQKIQNMRRNLAVFAFCPRDDISQDSAKIAINIKLSKHESDEKLQTVTLKNGERANKVTFKRASGIKESVLKDFIENEKVVTFIRMNLRRFGDPEYCNQH